MCGEKHRKFAVSSHHTARTAGQTPWSLPQCTIVFAEAWINFGAFCDLLSKIAQCTKDIQAYSQQAVNCEELHSLVTAHMLELL